MNPVIKLLEQQKMRAQADAERRQAAAEHLEIKPPISWRREEQDEFALLAREYPITAAAIARREQERDRGFQRKCKEFQELKKRLEANNESKADKDSDSRAAQNAGDTAAGRNAA